MSLEIPIHTLYRLINSSTDGTSSPTSLNIVLYCDNKRVQAGEYLFEILVLSSIAHFGNETHSAAVMESRTYARSR